jgi:hypothetical protein
MPVGPSYWLRWSLVRSGRPATHHERRGVVGPNGLRGGRAPSADPFRDIFAMWVVRAPISRHLRDVRRQGAAMWDVRAPRCGSSGRRTDPLSRHLRASTPRTSWWAARVSNPAPARFERSRLVIVVPGRTRIRPVASTGSCRAVRACGHPFRDHGVTTAPVPLSPRRAGVRNPRIRDGNLRVDGGRGRRAASCRRGRPARPRRRPSGARSHREVLAESAANCAASSTSSAGCSRTKAKQLQIRDVMGRQLIPAVSCELHLLREAPHRMPCHRALSLQARKRELVRAGPLSSSGLARRAS